MRKLKLIETPTETKSIRLHENILDILFSHKQDVFRKLCDIKGIYFLDHIAITIIDPDNKVVIFSITPSVEYNIIIQNLWKYDYTFMPNKFPSGSLVWWDENLADEFGVNIIELKKLKHHFTAGMNLYKRLENFTIIYSFATRHKMANIHHYYENIVNELYNLGDYSYKLIRSLYEGYCINHVAPQLNEAALIRTPHLRLIINNKHFKDHL